MKLMLLRTTKKTARLQTPWGMKNHDWRVPVGFLTHSDYKGVKKTTLDTQLRLCKTTWGCNFPHRCIFWARRLFLLVGC